MKRNLYLFIVILFFTQHALAQKADNKLYYHNRPNSIQSSPNETGDANFTGQSGTGANIDVVYHRIWWRINPDSAKAIKGTITTHFKTIAANLASITFDLRQSAFNNANLVVKYHGITCTRTVSASNVLSITLPSTIVASGTLDSVVVNYYGVPPGVAGAAQGYQVATDATSGQNVIYTLSESYEDRDWWPCKADMQDKIDSMDIIVNTPWTGVDTFWVATNGQLVDSTITGNNRTFTFKNRYPMASYLVCVSVARYKRYYRSINIGGTEMPVAYYLIRGKSAANYTAITNAMDLINQVVVAFGNKFGDYPYKYEKHGFYDGLAGAGGMEHQTFSAIDGGTTVGGTGSLTSTSVLSHELMHQWFGDKATFATWADLWLAEGFARYGEALAGELVPATGINPAAERSAAKTSARSISTNRTRITSFATSAAIWTNANVAAVYDRGCMVVSMLRALSGDNNFFLACRNYLDSMNGSGYKSANSDSLKLNFNRVLNYDLTPFFNDWVIGQGHPTTVINWNSPIAKRLAVSVNSQTRTAGATAAYFHNVIVIRVKGALAIQDTVITFYDIDGNNLAKAGLSTGIGPAVPGNLLIYDLSFTPTSVTFDSYSQTMSAGSLVALPGLGLGVLAVRVHDFSARKTATGNESTLSLTTTDLITKIELLKSVNGLDFTIAGQMNLVHSGNQTFNYKLTDADPFYPATFYKAKIYSAGKEELTNIVKVQSSPIKEITVSPNPANAEVKINFQNPQMLETTVLILSGDGKKIMESTTHNNFINFTVKDFSSGIYLVQILQPGQVSETRQFLIQH